MTTSVVGIWITQLIGGRGLRRDPSRNLLKTSIPPKIGVAGVLAVPSLLGMVFECKRL